MAIAVWLRELRPGVAGGPDVWWGDMGENKVSLAVVNVTQSDISECFSFQERRGGADGRAIPGPSDIRRRNYLQSDYGGGWYFK